MHLISPYHTRYFIITRGHRPHQHLSVSQRTKLVFVTDRETNSFETHETEIKRFVGNDTESLAVFQSSVKLVFRFTHVTRIHEHKYSELFAHY